jgi:peptidoglycan/LPS O-acetylase OafA/YrhL
MRADRLRALDGIRGIAVFLVILHHWTEQGYTQELGNLGVQMFFVLSGFLITAILLDLREARESGGVEMSHALARFWQSRFARILPVVVLTLAFVAAFGERLEPRANLIWHATFTSNFLFFLHGEYGSNLAHFWSLAVEQQFYLIWPIIILRVPRRALEPIVVSLVVLAPLARFTLFHAGYTIFEQFNVLPFCNFDSLGCGALLAIWMREDMETTNRRLHFLAFLALAAAVAFVANRALGRLPWNAEQTFASIMAAWLIAVVVRYPKSLPARTLSWKPLVALGIVSYGVYAYHVFAPRTAGFLLRRLGVPEEFTSGIPMFVISLLGTFLVAWLSWRCVEKPINEARRRWQERSTLKPLVRAAEPDRLRATE